MPDNAIYYHVAYIASAAIYGIYAVTLYWRWKRLKKR